MVDTDSASISYIVDKKFKDIDVFLEEFERYI